MNENKDANVVEDDEIITLTYDNGEEEEFFNMGELDYQGKWYIFLQPVEKEDDFDDDEILVYELAETDDNEELILPIEDNALIEKLVNMFNEELQKLN